MWLSVQLLLFFIRFSIFEPSTFREFQLNARLGANGRTSLVDKSRMDCQLVCLPNGKRNHAVTNIVFFVFRHLGRARRRSALLSVTSMLSGYSAPLKQNSGFLDLPQARQGMDTSRRVVS